MKMKHFLRIRASAFVLIFLLASCEKAVDWPLDGMMQDRIIVEGIITNENKIQEIKLSLPFKNPNEPAPVVSGAGVQVSSADGVFLFSEDPDQPGLYRSEQPFRGLPGRTYTLLISYGGEIITAKAPMTASQDFVFLKYARDPETKLFRIIWVANTYNAKRAAMYEILLDWSEVAGYEHLEAHETRARLIYYTLPTLDVSQIFAPPAETVLFPSGTKITERRYSLAPEHADFIRAVLLETSWQGGYFSSASANLPTNLSGKGAGFFGACAVTTKTGTARLTGLSDPTGN